MKSIGLQFALVGASYFLGAIPFGLIFSKLKGIDLRLVGSGNVGATNVFRSVGKGWGITTFLCDFGKGFVPAGLFPLWAEHYFQVDVGPVQPVLWGCAAIIGHNWSLYIRFKGGKGVAASAGVLAGIAPSAAGVGVLAWVILVLATGYVSIGSMGAAAFTLLAGWVLYIHEGLFLPMVLTALGLLVIWKHRDNIHRLREGTEGRSRFKKPRTDLDGYP